MHDGCPTRHWDIWHECRGTSSHPRLQREGTRTCQNLESRSRFHIFANPDPAIIHEVNEIFNLLTENFFFLPLLYSTYG
jgi:hypothetical protein